MAKSKSKGCCACKNDNNACRCHGRSNPFSFSNAAFSPQETIDEKWIAFPPQVKSFILDSPNGSFTSSSLLDFWSNPEMIECTRGGLASGIYVSAFDLALVHLQAGMYKEARALTINGSFIHQCCNSSIEKIKAVFQSVHPTEMQLEREVPYYIHGCNAIRSLQAMEKYIRSCLPKEYITSMKGHINPVSYDWNSTSASKKIHQPPTTIEIVFVDDGTNGGKHSFDIGSSTSLKSLFNDYADKRGISLRSLRFSFAGNTLFLSSAGRKTPEELGWQNGDFVKVHNMSLAPSDDGSSCQTSISTSSSASKKTKSKKRSNKKAKGKNKKPQQSCEPTKTLEEYKVQHSIQLTRIHGEAQARFKVIRQRLNNLVIERSEPKARARYTRTPKQDSYTSSVVEAHPLKEGLAGKAGKSCFVIQVGDVQNLYKTTKPSSTNSISSVPVSPLDLHGCTREEALVKLDESLNVWFDAAMQGSYPFVKSAVIVCGCGSQTLSETVQDWIRSNDKVSNAPQFRSSRKQGFVSSTA